MNKTQQTLATGFTLFALFFGAGNLILPPYLGLQAGESWFFTAMGFAVSAVCIPILGIYAHARLQGTMLDFANKVSPLFSIVFCSLIYLISATIPSPRTASVTHEMAVAPLFDIPSWVTSGIYFTLVFAVAVKRNSIIDIVGKYLTPVILTLLAVMIVLSFTLPLETAGTALMSPGFSGGLLEGYQTFDAMGAVVVGAVIIISLSLRGEDSFESRKRLITRAGILAGSGLLITYGGLIAAGALFSGNTGAEISRTELLNLIAQQTLGAPGRIFLSLLISLACFTTAVGIVTGTADHIQGVLKGGKGTFTISAALASLIGILVGSLNVGFIIDVAYPILLLIYPLIIVYIFLNSLPDFMTGKTVFRILTFVVVLFSIPDALKAILSPEQVPPWLDLMPLSEYQMGWLLPVVATYVFLIIKKPADKNQPV
ncbi:branched-chain amino acid transport system II carrier protein [Robertkochia aurantiaca]|uniref:branched-chain amino acid transport system II carrier protein n=1 Tax=Robertkochia aurantiaca TaxID=2873700 RepID=UPI001CCB024C|nr:branched-chain amino acid transport system II carrier protein [Robertkochia sp. 3YJGBD-33]